MQEDEQWMVRLESTKWLDYIVQLLASANRVVASLQKGITTLVHCSDGWDRTPQLCALTMLLSDPFYRTLKGFEVLIEKEWVSFGHAFNMRIGHCRFNNNDSERSPIFIQFLDCVHQLLWQNPTSFQFNETFLCDIAEAVYSCRFGTFLCDSEKHQHALQVQRRTNSLWSMINYSQSRFINSKYSPNISTPAIVATTESIRLRFWKSCYIQVPICLKMEDVHWDADSFQPGRLSLVMSSPSFGSLPRTRVLSSSPPGSPKQARLASEEQKPVDAPIDYNGMYSPAPAPRENPTPAPTTPPANDVSHSMALFKMGPLEQRLLSERVSQLESENVILREKCTHLEARCAMLSEQLSSSNKRVLQAQDQIKQLQQKPDDRQRLSIPTWIEDYTVERGGFSTVEPSPVSVSKTTPLPSASPASAPVPIRPRAHSQLVEVTKKYNKP